MPHNLFWMRLWFDIMTSLKMLLLVIDGIYPMNDGDYLSWDGITLLAYIGWMMDLGVGFILFSRVVKIVWFFDFYFHFEYVFFSRPYAFIPFMPFMNGLLQVLAWSGSRVMVEGKMIFNRGNLGRLTKAPLWTHLT